jgi:hypothetical protein
MKFFPLAVGAALCFSEHAVNSQVLDIDTFADGNVTLSNLGLPMNSMEFHLYTGTSMIAGERRFALVNQSQGFQNFASVSGGVLTGELNESGALVLRYGFFQPTGTGDLGGDPLHLDASTTPFVAITFSAVSTPFRMGFSSITANLSPETSYINVNGPGTYYGSLDKVDGFDLDIHDIWGFQLVIPDDTSGGVDMSLDSIRLAGVPEPAMGTLAVGFAASLFFVCRKVAQRA